VTKFPRVAAFAVVFLIVSLAGVVAMAQQPGMAARPAPNGIALLDISKIFKSHARFLQAMEEMKGDVGKAEAQMKSEAEYVNSLVEALKQLKPGTVDYSTKEQEIARRRADMNVRIQLQRKEFLLREAKIYHQVYQEISKEVEAFAATNGIVTVFRYNGDQVDAENPEDVLKNINKPVVYFNPGMDITAQILERLNRDGAPGQGPRASTATRPAVGVPRPNR
jgi:Skp family chaperone for outer membrane proteins